MLSELFNRPANFASDTLWIVSGMIPRENCRKRHGLVRIDTQKTHNYEIGAHSVIIGM